jgi:hypothetical protein
MGGSGGAKLCVGKAIATFLEHESLKLRSQGGGRLVLLRPKVAFESKALKVYSALLEICFTGIPVQQFPPASRSVRMVGCLCLSAPTWSITWAACVCQHQPCPSRGLPVSVCTNLVHRGRRTPSLLPYLLPPSCPLQRQSFTLPCA